MGRDISEFRTTITLIIIGFEGTLGDFEVVLAGDGVHGGFAARNKLTCIAMTGSTMGSVSGLFPTVGRGLILTTGYGMGHRA